MKEIKIVELLLEISQPLLTGPIGQIINRDGKNLVIKLKKAYPGYDL